MAKQNINIGSNANDGTGDPLRTAFQKINDNFAELYGDDSSADTFTSPQITNGTLNGLTTINNILIENSEITTSSNANIILNPMGAATIELQAPTNITGVLDVTGAVTLDTSLTLSAGATITEFSTNTSLGTSNTVVPTQNAVKTYIDAQNVAQAITFVGDDSTGTAVNAGETFQILGGTGLTAAVSGDAVTLDIDATVATLTGAQTLTNKILTTPTISSPSITGHATIEGVTPTGATGTGNLVFSDAPTFSGILAAANITASGTLGVTGTTTLSGTLNVVDVLTSGSQIISGNATVQGTLFSDRIQSPASNANLVILSQGTGVVDVQSALTTVGQTITGTASITGQLNADNIRIDSNTISATNANGGINITPNGSGVVTVSTTVQANRLSASTIIEVDPTVGHVDTNSLRTVSTNADLVISTGPGTGVLDFNVPTQTTVGAAGAASALPATPSGYLNIKIDGVEFCMPFYART